MSRRKMINIESGSKVEQVRRVQRITLAVLAGLCVAAAVFLGSVLWRWWRGGPEDALVALQTPRSGNSAGGNTGAAVGAGTTAGTAQTMGAVRAPQEYVSARSGWIFKRPWQRVPPAPEGDGASAVAIPPAPPVPYQSNYTVKGILFGAGPPVVTLAEKSTGKIINAMVGDVVGEEEIVLIRASFVILRRGGQETRLELP